MRKEQEIFIAQQVAELRGIVIEGFKGVHQRQDIANHRTSKIEDRVDRLEKAKDVSEGERKGMSAAKATLLTIITIAVAILGLFAASGCWGIVCHK